MFGEEPDYNLETIEKAIPAYYPELMGEEIVFIGQGTYARAYKVGSLVFKITRDLDDATASLRIKGKDLKHLVKVHRVFRISNQRRWLIVSDFVPNALRDVSKYRALSGKLNSIHTSFARHLYLRLGEGEVSFDFGLSSLVQREVRDFFKELLDNDFTNVDIQPANVRSDANGIFKLIDLGHMTSRKESREPRFEKLY